MVEYSGQRVILGNRERNAARFQRQQTNGVKYGPGRKNV
jgi:hypothetical protein